MATDPIVPFQYPAVGFANAGDTGENFETLLTYIRERNNGTAFWDGPIGIGALPVAGTNLTVKNVSGNYGIEIVNGSKFLRFGAGDPEIAASGANLVIKTLTPHDIIFRGDSNTTDVQILRLDSTGEVLQPNQPSFVVYLSADALNVTGDGTNYTVIWDTEVRDAGSDYDNTTGVFTASVTGQYLFCVNPNITGLLSTHTQIYVQLVTSNATYLSRFTAGTNPLSNFAPALSWLVDMDSADTASVIVQVSNGTKVVDIGGGANRQSAFFGSLVN